MLLKGFTDNTIKAFQADLRILTEFIPNSRPISQISTQDLKDFLEVSAQRSGPALQSQIVCPAADDAQSALWMAGRGRRAGQSDPAASLVHTPVKTPLPRVLSDEQVEELLATARVIFGAEESDPRPLLLVMLLLQTGIKKSECMGIHLSHLDLTDRSAPTLQIRYEQVRQQYKERNLKLEPDIIPIVRAYRNKYKPVEYLFECTARNLEYVLRDLAKLAGIPGGVSFEMLRWTAAVRDYKADVAEDALRRKLGLSKLRWRETVEKLKQLTEPAL